MDELLKKEHFDPHLNTEFEIIANGVGSIQAQLVQVNAWNRDLSEGFKLLFKGPKEPVFPHATLVVKHPSMGEFEIFLGPVMVPKQDGVYYEAIFNRMKED